MAQKKKTSNCPFKAKIHHSSSKPSLPQDNISNAIPVESEPLDPRSSRLAKKKVMISSPKREDGSSAKAPVHAAKAKSKSTSRKEDDSDPVQQRDDEGKKPERAFSAYISKMKDRMRTVSNVGSVGRTATRRDSFNDKVSSYINRAKLKIRATTMKPGDDGERSG